MYFSEGPVSGAPANAEAFPAEAVLAEAVVPKAVVSKKKSVREANNKWVSHDTTYT